MLRKVEFLKDYRCFKKGDTFEFRPGVNLLVGEQGTGKSTVLDRLKEDGKSKVGGEKILRVDCDRVKFMAFDFERDTPRGKSAFSERMDFMAQVQCLFISHGEMNNAILKSLEVTNDTLFVMDEPDMALSIRSCRKLVDRLKIAEKNGCQVLVAVHNPVIIGSFDEVLSFEHRKWMPSKDFIECHMTQEYDGPKREGTPLVGKGE